MKEIVEYFQQKGILFKSLKAVLPKALGSRKKITIWVGVDLRGYYVSVMLLQKKSRVLRKEVEGLIALHTTLEHYVDSAIKRRHIIICAPLCSKAKALLQEHSWVIHHKEHGCVSEE